MPTEPKSKHIPRATIQRLATYVQVLENFARDGVEVISSNPLAEACGVNGSQVRKDLAYFGEFFTTEPPGKRSGLADTAGFLRWLYQLTLPLTPWESSST